MHSPIKTSSQEQVEPLAYQTDAALTTAQPQPTLNSMYETLDALRAAAPNAVLLKMGDPGGPNARTLRARLTVGITDAEDEVVQEELYLVSPCNIRTGGSTSESVLVERIASISWTAGAQTVAGGRSGERLPKTAVLSNTGRLASITGVEVAGAGSDPELVTVYDVGPGTYLLRSLVQGSGTPANNFSPLGSRWQ